MRDYFKSIISMHNLDIKSLRVIHTLVNCGSVTRSAELLNVPPGAISYYINKARKSTNTALFFKTKNGMMPDNIARELSKRYLSIVNNSSFSSKAINLSSRDITLSSYAILELLIGISFNHRSETRKINFTPLPTDDSERLQRLRNKEVDIDIGTRLTPDNNIIQSRLFSCGVKIVANKQYPLSNDQFSLSDWEKATHIIWGRGMHLFHDDFEHVNLFHKHMNLRNIVCKASNSINMILMAAYSQHVVLMPEVIANQLLGKIPIKLFTPPPELQMIYECFIHYHKSYAEEKIISDMLQSLCAIF